MTDYTEHPIIAALAERAGTSDGADPAFLREVVVEIERLRAERDEDRRREYGYSQQTVDALTAERDRLRAALSDAINEVEFWGEYATAYFQEKHDLAGSLATLRAALDGAAEPASADVTETKELLTLPTLAIHYDPWRDVLTVEGIRYSGQLFRALGGALELGRWFKVEKREPDGALCITAAPPGAPDTTTTQHTRDDQ